MDRLRHVLVVRWTKADQGASFKGCIAWRPEIITLWKKVGELSCGKGARKVRCKRRKGFGYGFKGEAAGPGSTPIRDLTSDGSFVEAVLAFWG